MSTRLSTQDRWALVLLTFLAAALRFWNLGGHSLWFDEALNVQDASHPFGSLHRVILASPPLYHYLIRIFLLLLGHNDFWLRVPSAFFGVVTIPLAYLIFRRWFGQKPAVWTALLWTLSPFHIVYSQELRMYSLVALEALGLLYAWDRVTETDRVQDWAVFTLISVCALYTHNWFLFYITALAAGWLLIRLRDRAAMKQGLIAFGVIGLIWLPWLPVLIAQTHQPIYEEYVPWAYHLRRLVQAFAGVVIPCGHDWVQLNSSPLRWLGGILAAGFLIYGFGRSDVPRDRIQRLGLFGLALPILLTFGVHALWGVGLRAGRHTMIFLPVFFAVIAHVFVPREPMHDRRVHAAAVLWIALWIAPLANYYTTYVKAPWKEASRAILSAAQPGDTLLYKNVLEFDRISLNYYVPASFLRAEEIQKSGSPGRFFWPTRTYETAERIQQIQRPWRVAGAYPAGKVTVLLVVHDARMRGPKAP